MTAIKTLSFAIFTVFTAILAFLRIFQLKTIDADGMLPGRTIFAGFPLYIVALIMFFCVWGLAIFLSREKQTYFTADFGDENHRPSFYVIGVFGVLLYVVAAMSFVKGEMFGNKYEFLRESLTYDNAKTTTFLALTFMAAAAVAICFNKLTLSGVFFVGSAITSALAASAVFNNNLLIKRLPHLLLVFLAYVLLALYYLALARIFIVKKPNMAKSDLTGLTGEELKTTEREYNFRYGRHRLYALIFGISAAGIIVSETAASIVKYGLPALNAEYLLLPLAAHGLLAVVALWVLAGESPRTK
ncbi:MAG: hypothetical protein LBN42_02920 [Oscillospiraceae bacterium]|jgi:hypothetical protein|nr:hypothetical protein [Oscillospiraceae bacterium]